MATVDEVQALLHGARRLIVLAGAGMSAELAVPTYWTGPNAKYGDTVSKHGYTELEHASADLWGRDFAAQEAFFAERYKHLNTIDVHGQASPYAHLLDFIDRRELDYFVGTSNVDSFFLRAGFEEPLLYEIHGAYRHSQCMTKPRQHGIFPTDPSGITMCPVCQGRTRPNVMFFNDFTYNPTYMYAQRASFDDFREAMVSNRDVVIEIGAGNTVPTIRNLSVIMSGRYDLPVIRINPHPVQGVDGIARMVPKSATAPFITVRQPVGTAFKWLFE